jgi:hypothetical protein
MMIRRRFESVGKALIRDFGVATYLSRLKPSDRESVG